MPIFKYKAISRDGVTVTGNVDAANEADLDLRVTRMELELISFSAARARIGSRQKVTRRDLITFCYHLEQLARAGVPIHEGLVDLRDSVDNPVFREVISAITQSIEAGKTLSQALAEHPKVFDDVFAQLIRAGEEAGQLPDVVPAKTASADVPAPAPVVAVAAPPPPAAKPVSVVRRKPTKPTAARIVASVTPAG